MDHSDKVDFVRMLNAFGDMAVILITHDPALCGIGREVKMGEVNP